MNQNLFIPGDWVKYDGITVQVIGSRPNFSLLSDIIYTDKEPWVMNKEIKGIHLTPEILEKNGWEKRGNDYIKENDGLVLRFVRESFLFFIIEGVGNKYLLLNDIDYVHQLQHILWALDLNSKMEV